MSHSTVLVILKDHDVELFGLDDALATALAPFDENADTERYVKYTRQQAIDAQRKELIYHRDEGNYARYLKDPAGYLAKTHAGHAKYISETFPEHLKRLDDDDWLYGKAIEFECESNIDADGSITSTYNPKSQWDWYTVGGRWSGSVLNATETIHHPEEVMSPTWTQPAWDERAGGVDQLRKKDLTDHIVTFAFLDAGGEWHERAKMGWWGLTSDDKPEDEWEAEFTGLLNAVDDEDWIVLVDVHI